MSSTRPSRRTLLEAAVGLGLAGIAGAGLRRLRGTPLGRNRLRPPGAVAEAEFGDRCVRCGGCAEACPFFAIRLAGPGEGLEAGTPVVRVAETPCYLCLECIPVCPSGALLPVEMEETRMGLAVIDREACAAWNKTSLCRTCVNVCPLPEVAIRLPELRPEVIEEGCVGCGICVHGCPVTRPDGAKAINVVPPGEGGAA